MSDSVRPYRRQPVRLPRPWGSPGMNTGVGCHFLLQCMKVKSKSEDAQSCLTLSDPMDCSPPGSSVHGMFQARVLEWGAIAFSGPCGWGSGISDDSQRVPPSLSFSLQAHWKGRMLERCVFLKTWTTVPIMAWAVPSSWFLYCCRSGKRAGSRPVAVRAGSSSWPME